MSDFSGSPPSPRTPPSYISPLEIENPPGIIPGRRITPFSISQYAFIKGYRIKNYDDFGCRCHFCKIILEKRKFIEKTREYQLRLLAEKDIECIEQIEGILSSDQMARDLSEWQKDLVIHLEMNRELQGIIDRTLSEIKELYKNHSLDLILLIFNREPEIGNHNQRRDPQWSSERLVILGLTWYFCDRYIKNQKCRECQLEGIPKV